jgi:hypothetical protein
MLKAASILIVLAGAGVVAGGSLGSAPARQHALRIGALHASFKTVICKPKQKKHCVKPKPAPVRTRTVTATVTQTVATTVTQTVTTTQTVTVTVTPSTTPKVGQYVGRTSNNNTIRFAVAGGPTVFTVANLSIDEVDSTCTSTASPGSVAHLTVYNSSFADAFTLDASGHFSGTATETFDNGDYITVSVGGAVTSGQASGSISSVSLLHDTQNKPWKCSNTQATWTASGQ